MSSTYLPSYQQPQPQPQPIPTQGMTYSTQYNSIQPKFVFTKAEFVEWFRNESPANRIEIGCALLESLFPTELRFLGTFAEELLSKDYTEIRPVIREANHINGAKGAEEKRRTVCRTLLSDASPAILRALGTVLSQCGPIPPLPLDSRDNSSSNNTKNSGPCLSDKPSTPSPPPNNSTTNSTARSTPPPTTTVSIGTSTCSPLLKSSTSITPTVGGRRPTPSPTPNPATTPESSSLLNGSLSMNPNSQVSSTEHPQPPLDLLIFSSDKARKRLVLYICFMSVHNREVSRVYYSLLSLTDQTIGSQKWIDQQSLSAIEDLNLLYTVAALHPAFTFEHRIMIKGVLTKIRTVISLKQQAENLKETAEKAAVAATAASVASKQSQSAQVSQQQSAYHHQPQAQSHAYYTTQHMPTYDRYYYPVQYTMPTAHQGSSQVPVQAQSASGAQGYYAATYQQQSYVYSMPNSSQQHQPQGGIAPATAPQITPTTPALTSSIGNTNPLLPNQNSIISAAEDPELYEIAFHPGPPCDKTGTRRVPCCNCGSQDHSVRECEGPTLEQLTHNFSHLKYGDASD